MRGVYTARMIKSHVGELVAARKLTTSAFAEQAGLAPNTARALVRGDSTRIDLATLHTLCVFFGVGVGDLLEYVPDDRDAAT